MTTMTLAFLDAGLVTPDQTPERRAAKQRAYKARKAALTQARLKRDKLVCQLIKAKRQKRRVRDLRAAVAAANETLSALRNQ